MTLSTRAIEDLLRAMLPVGNGSFELRLAPDEEPVFDTSDGGVRARLQLLVFETAGEREIRDAKEQELYLLNVAQRADATRAEAFLRAWIRGIPGIAERCFGGEVEMIMPHDLLFPEALDEAGARDEADFLALFESTEWLARCCREREESEFAETMAYLGVGEHAERLRALRRPAIRLVVDADLYAYEDEDENDEDEDEDELEDDSPLGGSRIGGLPDLPPGVEWPRIDALPLSFLAQIRLADLRGLPGVEELPESGLLAFFYDADGRTNVDERGKWCWPVRHRGGTRVIHFPGDPATFIRAQPPEDGLRVFPVYPVLRREVERMMPSLESPFYEALDDEPHEQPWYDRFSRVVATSEEDRERPIHRLLGYTSELQGDPYLEAHMYSTGQDFGDAWDHNGARERDLRREATRWRLLLQVDSTPGDLLAQDGGYFYFLIREDDLAARRFDQVWGISHGH